MIIEYLTLLNNNKILWGVSMILLNMGSRYVIADIGKLNERLLTNELFKKVILYAMFFVATRDLLISFLLTVVYTLLIDGILHEKRNFHVYQNVKTTAAITEQEYNDAKGLIKRYEENTQAPHAGDNIYQQYLAKLANI